MSAFRKYSYAAVLLTTIALIPAAAVSEEPKVDGAVCNIDKVTHTMRIIPWDRGKQVWDSKNVRTFKLIPLTAIEGETKATVAELEGGKATIKSFHFTGMSIQGGAARATGTPFEIKDISQLLHRRATVSWVSSAQVPEATRIGLPYLFGGESMPAMVGSSGAQTVGIHSDDVTLKCDSK
jgi:hypothetical protein